MNRSERNFIDGRIERHAVCLVVDKSGQGSAVFGKAIHETRGENIHLVRAAIMENIPYDLDVVPAGSFQYRDQGGEIKYAIPLNERPAGPITHGADVKTFQQFIIGGDLDIMLRKGKHIQALSGLVDVAGRLKACQKERIEQVQGYLRK